MFRSMNKKTNPSNDAKMPEWPNTVRTRDELDSALEAGFKSGVSKLSGKQIVERALARLDNG